MGPICGALGNGVIGVEIAMLPVRAGHDGKAKPACFAFRQGSGAANIGDGLADAEAVKINLSGRQAFRNDLDAIIARGVCCKCA